MSTKYPLCDWISFSVDAPMNKSRTAPQWLDPLNVKLCRRQAMVETTKRIGVEAMRTLFGNLPSDENIGRFPYRYAVIDNDTSARIQWSSELSHIGVEISGRGCKHLHSSSQIEKLVADVATNCSRIDLSCDLHVDTTPTEFVAGGYSNRFTAHSVHRSDGGETWYIGSPKSEKRAAVYRYNSPHPRHEFLRVEHRFRGNTAKHMCNYVGVNGLAMAVSYAGLMFDWKSPLWPKAELELMDLPHLEVDAKDSHFAHWLLKQVFPAMRRAEVEGKIEDLRAFVQMHLFDDDEP